MGLHDRAWAGLNLLIYGKTPMLPMQLEQAMTAASPENEIRIDSFEDYDDALDHAKEKQNVGLIFILENCGALPLKDVFKELSRPYENKGWPCFGILIYTETESIKGLRAMQECPNIIGYLPAESFLKAEKTAHTMNSIWSDFNAKFQDKIIPLPLQQTLLAIAESKISATGIHFMDRISTLLSSNLNISWIETISMRWNPVIQEIMSSGNTSAIAPHSTLIQISALSNYSGPAEDISTIVFSKNTLCSRIVTLTTLLERKRSENSLSEFLQKIGTQNKPGAPALLRHVINYRDRILAIANEEEETEKMELTG